PAALQARDRGKALDYLHRHQPLPYGPLVDAADAVDAGVDRAAAQPAPADQVALDRLQAGRAEVAGGGVAVQGLQRAQGVPQAVPLAGRGAVGGAVVLLGVPPERQDDLVDADVHRSARRRLGLCPALVGGQLGEDTGVFRLGLGRLPRAEQDLAAAPV